MITPCTHEELYALDAQSVGPYCALLKLTPCPANNFAAGYPVVIERPNFTPLYPGTLSPSKSYAHRDSFRSKQ